ncbi:type II toxin-antitoxin system HicA family toxin [Verrucomicrobia bacterium]|nr:type II toxin-antitoxin system HicA family toxin [Verrucomicrobiota bacterium]
MKRQKLIQELKQAGCILIRHGGKHDIYHNPSNGKSQPIPGHRETNEILANKIIRDLI